MVSSTFYDLRQIRKDLAEFIDNELGYNALLSEYDSFPIDPDADTIENCRRRVEKNADILVLIIGGRYGYIDKKSDKSITNLEYLTARAKGIPVYTFIDKTVLSVLPVWQQNPKAKFKDIVSDTKVFEFIQQVRNVNKDWTYEFDHAQSIIQTLKKQFAYLMSEGLQMVQKLNSTESLPKNISGKALRIILERPSAWEYYLFAQVLIDEVEKYTDLREEHRLNLSIRTGESIPQTLVVKWMQERMTELSRFALAISRIMNEYCKVAFGLPGQPGDSKAIVFAAQKVVDVYGQALEWASRVRHVYVEPGMQPAVDLMISFPDEMIEKVSSLGSHLKEKLDEAFLSPQDQPVDLTILLQLKEPVNMQEFLKVAEECIISCASEGNG